MSFNAHLPNRGFTTPEFVQGTREIVERKVAICEFRIYIYMYNYIYTYYVQDLLFFGLQLLNQDILILKMIIRLCWENRVFHTSLITMIFEWSFYSFWMRICDYWFWVHHWFPTYLTSNSNNSIFIWACGGKNSIVGWYLMFAVAFMKARGFHSICVTGC